MCVTDRKDMTLAVRAVLNPNTTTNHFPTISKDDNVAIAADDDDDDNNDSIDNNDDDNIGGGKDGDEDEDDDNEGDEADDLYTATYLSYKSRICIFVSFFFQTYTFLLVAQEFNFFRPQNDSAFDGACPDGTLVKK